MPPVVVPPRVVRPRLGGRSTALLAGPVLVLVLTAASCGDGPSGVTLGSVGRGTVDEIVEAPGSVTARGAATLSASADGTLAELLVDDGDRVRKGQVLAVIDAPAVLARKRSAARALRQASQSGPSAGGTAGVAAGRRQADRRAAQAFDNARDAAAKVTDPTLRAALLKQVAAARQQYAAASDAVAATLRSVQRGVASLGQALGALSAAQRMQAQQAYELAAAAVDALTLRAPLAGIVQLGGPTSSGGTSGLDALLSGGAAPTALPGAAGGSTPQGVDRGVSQGAYLTAGTPVVTIVDTGRLRLAAEVDETDVLLVRPGTTATVELDAATGATYAATVRAVDLLPTTSARGGVSYQVRLDLGRGAYADSSPAPDPRPGMSAVIRLRVRQATDAVTVPAGAIVNADGQDTVWAVRDGRYQRIPVTVGVQGEDVVQVTGGVAPGQQIAVGGTDKIRAGDQIS